MKISFGTSAGLANSQENLRMRSLSRVHVENPQATIDPARDVRSHPPRSCLISSLILINPWASDPDKGTTLSGAVGHVRGEQDDVSSMHSLRDRGGSRGGHVEHEENRDWTRPSFPRCVILWTFDASDFRGSPDRRHTCVNCSVHSLIPSIGVCLCGGVVCHRDGIMYWMWYEVYECVLCFDWKVDLCEGVWKRCRASEGWILGVSKVWGSLEKG